MDAPVGAPPPSLRMIFSENRNCTFRDHASGGGFLKWLWQSSDAIASRERICFVFTLPWRGRVGHQKCAGGGGRRCTGSRRAMRAFTPTRRASRDDLPPPGGGDCGASIAGKDSNEQMELPHHEQREEKIVRLAAGGKAPHSERVASAMGRNAHGASAPRLRSASVVALLLGPIMPARPELHRKPVVMHGAATAEDFGGAQR